MVKEVLKRLRYLSLACVIIIGLLTIVGSGGDDGDDTGSTGSTDDTGTTESDTEELSMFEEALVGKWSRYHAYDDSYMYFIFKSDRTACYFEYTDSSRTENSNYPYWRLDEDNPIDDNVFAIEIQYSSGSWKSSDEFHYTIDEVWKGGYSNLDMSPSSTSRDCEEE